jgi:cell division protein FtsL
MKLALALVLSLFLALISYEVYQFTMRTEVAEGELRAAEARKIMAEKDYERLKADYDYYSQSANIEKELRARFNYRAPDEKMMIIIPRRTSSSSQ